MHYKILNFLIITIVISINLFVFCATSSKEKENTSIFQQHQLQQQQLQQHQQQQQQQQQPQQQQQQQQQSPFSQQHQYYNNIQQQDYNPLGPLVKCTFVPWEFLDCKEPYDHKGNVTAKEEMNHGCLKFGGVYYEDVERTKVRCTVLPDIECHGNRVFFRDGVPCIRKTGHYFVTTLLYSILLGFLGMDRFSLGQTGTAVGKLLTLGGVGVWWIIDIILLVTNNLLPEDGSNWNSYV